MIPTQVSLSCLTGNTEKTLLGIKRVRLSCEFDASFFFLTLARLLILHNSKWDKRTLSSLYLLAISQRADIRSLRDLRTEHLPLLKTIRDKILALVPEKFPGVAEDEVRLFVHYHPSYCKPSIP